MQSHHALGSRLVTRRDERSAAQVILETLSAHGVTTAFGIPGGLISPIYDALADGGIRLVSTRHEAMAGYAAMGHAVATGMPALVLTTSGPGLTNVLTAIAAAAAEELPLIAIAGEVSTQHAARACFQDATTNALDAVSMMRTVTRWSARIEAPAAAAGMTARAVQMASGPRPGPVFLSLPMNVGNAPAPSAPILTVPPEAPCRPDLASAAQIAHALERARKPLIIAGHGARGAAHALRELAERLAIPVTTTAHGKAVFPESHPLHLGILGFGGHTSVAEFLASGPDVVLIVGSRLGDFATDGWSLPVAGSVATFQIDRNPSLIGRNCPVTVGLVADATDALRAIAAALTPDVATPQRAPIGLASSRRDATESDAVPLKPARVLAALQRAFPDAFWASDIGEHCAHAVHHLRIDAPDRFRAMLGLAPMGSGIGLAMGVRHASRSRPVVCVCGDGGFAMHAGDILTCVEEGIDVVFVVMNDGRWNMVDHGFETVYGRRPAALPSRVADLVQVAAGFGAIGVRIARPEDLQPEVLRGVASAGRPVILDVRIDASESLSVASRSSAVRRAAFGGAA